MIISGMKPLRNCRHPSAVLRFGHRSRAALYLDHDGPIPFRLTAWLMTRSANCTNRLRWTSSLGESDTLDDFEDSFGGLGFLYRDGALGSHFLHRFSHHVADG